MRFAGLLLIILFISGMIGANLAVFVPEPGSAVAAHRQRRPTATTTSTPTATAIATATVTATPLPTLAPSPTPAATAPSPGPTATPGALQLSPSDVVYLPAGATDRQPLMVLVALHGLNGSGPGIAADLRAAADQHGWLLLAPTIAYNRAWGDPATLVADDQAVIRRLITTIDELPARTGLTTRPRVLLYGFSRGAQVAHRLALAYPRRVAAVAALSAGTYTLPQTTWTANGVTRPLPLPFGLADLNDRYGVTFDAEACRQVAFWLAVGEADNHDRDAPSAWTPYIGPNRVARAQAQHRALQAAGIPTSLTVVPGLGHAIAPDERAAALAFLASQPRQP